MSKSEPSLFESLTDRPLSDALRPASLDDFVGQEHIVGPGAYLRKIIEQGKPASMIFWGPPGCGKTTLARIIANASECAYEEISAVSSGLADVKQIIAKAKDRKRVGQNTLLFVDEIHRFNKAQQDAFLPHMEDGTIFLIGATTENPSFEVIGPLISRSRVVTLKPLTKVEIQKIINRGLSALKGKNIADDAKELLAEQAVGDSRIALNGLEAAAELTDKIITREHVKQALQTLAVKYDKSGEYHYNLISAFIKSLRGSDTDAALFYMMRMIEGGEDPKFVARRMVIFASEDIGLADPRALEQAVACFLSVERIGIPECKYNLTQAAMYLAKAPKSREVADKMSKTISKVAENPDAEVPLHLRNAVTDLMKDSGYGEGYKWQANFQHKKGFMPKQEEDPV